MRSFPFSTLDRNIVEGTTTLRGKIVQKYIAIGSSFETLDNRLEGKDNVELFVLGLVKHLEVGVDGKLERRLVWLVTFNSDDGLEMRNPEPIGLDGRGSGLLSKYDLEVFQIQKSEIGCQFDSNVGAVQDSLPKDIIDDSGYVVSRRCLA